MDVETTVQWLKDRELIKEVPQRYARGIDRIDFDMVRSAFHPDCQISGTVISGDLDPYLDWTERELHKFDATLHFMGNQYIDLEEGADEGHIETWAVAYHMRPEDSDVGDLILGLHYCDDVARFDEEADDAADPSIVFGLFDSGGSRIADGKRAMISEAIDKQFAAKGL